MKLKNIAYEPTKPIRTVGSIDPIELIELIDPVKATGNIRIMLETDDDVETADLTVAELVT